jgi:hypothetical protein
MNLQIAINKKQDVQEKDQQPALRQGMVDADLEASPSTQVRLASSFSFLFYLGGDYFSSSSPFLHNTQQLTSFSLLVLNNR